MKRKNIFFLITISVIVLLSCSRKTTQTTTMQDQKPKTPAETAAIPEPVVEEAPGTVQVTGPAVIVYKTKNDYYDKVPVSLSEDKGQVISFPAISDLYYKGELALPTRLNDGYLLDNRGISKDVAFLNITYESYSRLDMTPPVDLIRQMVLDDDPILEMYNCGQRSDYKDLVTEINTLIDKKKLKKFPRIK